MNINRTEKASYESEEHLLKEHDGYDETESCPQRRMHRNTWFTWLRNNVLLLCIFAALLYIAVIETINLSEKRRSSSDAFSISTPDIPYSPANPSLKYTRKKLFTEASSPFHAPPSPALDAAWYDLLTGQNIRVTGDELRAQGENMTARVQLVSGDYLGVLGVWHDLHCLDLLRRNVHMDYYQQFVPEEQWGKGVYSKEHFDHCIEYLRQSVMCHADVAAYSAVWVADSHEEESKVLVSDAERVCVDWNALDGWARERALERGQFKLRAGPFEKSHHADTQTA